MTYMTKENALVFAYERINKYSVNVLIAALEAGGLDRELALLHIGINEVFRILKQLRERFKRVILAVPLMTTQVPPVIKALTRATELARRLGVLSIAGGPHPSGDPYGTVLALGFDVAFIGEAEESLTEFVGKYIDGYDPLTVKGIAYWDGSRVVITGRRLAKDVNDYPPFSVKSSLFNPIEITRGCPFACKYCQVSYIFGTKLRHRSAESIARYASLLVKRGIRDIRFITPSFLSYGSSGKGVNLNALNELVERLQVIRERGGRVFAGTFPSEVRPEHVSEESVKVIKGRVDNKRIVLGAQTGSDRLLRLMNRGHDAEDVINAVRILKSKDFNVDVDYIFGIPGEEAEDVELTLSHIEKVVSLGGRVHAHVFLPLPGTPYSFAPPGTIRPRVRRAINKLLGKGLLYGQWMKQERLAREIARLRDSGVIIITAERARRLVGSGLKARSSVSAPR